MSADGAPAAAPRREQTLVVVAATAAVLAAGLVVVGGGLAVALVLAVTVLRDRPTARTALVVLGVALLLLALGAHSAPWGRPTLHVGPAVPALPAGQAS